MEKEGKNLESEIKLCVKKFVEKISSGKEVYIISHFDTDGITSAAIMVKALKRMDKRFCLKIIKGLEEKIVSSLPKNKIILFLDLASNSLEYIKKYGIEDVFIIDHHEIIQEIPENVCILNPDLCENEKISSSGLTYLFCKEISQENMDSSKIAVIGMIGDMLEKEIDRLNNMIINDGNIVKKRGLIIYPSTRPINKILEYSSSPYLPGITGNTEEVLEILREAEISPINGKYKSIIELNHEEMSKLITSILLRVPKKEGIIGDIFLIKMFNKLEDGRELSAIINACSRLGEPETAIKFCMEDYIAKKKAESIHIKYKQAILSGLKSIIESEKTEGNGFVIINIKNKIKDTLIGTIASIISLSNMYAEGTVIIAMAFDEKMEKIKVSARSAGRTGRNIREILNKVIIKIGGEVGGHKYAAGSIIEISKEEEFIKKIKEELEIEVIRV